MDPLRSRGTRHTTAVTRPAEHLSKRGLLGPGKEASKLPVRSTEPQQRPARQASVSARRTLLTSSSRASRHSGSYGSIVSSCSRQRATAAIAASWCSNRSTGRSLSVSRSKTIPALRLPSQCACPSRERHRRSQLRNLCGLPGRPSLSVELADQVVVQGLLARRHQQDVRVSGCRRAGCQ